MKRIVIPLLTAALFTAITADAGPLNPADFPSLGANPFTQAGTYSITTSGTTPTLFDPNNNPIATGVVANGLAVFTFDGIAIGSGVTVFGAREAGSRPIVLLSRSDFTIDGGIDVSGENGSDSPGNAQDFSCTICALGGKGGDAGPGGGGGGGGGSHFMVMSGGGGAGGVGLVNGASAFQHEGGSGGSVEPNGGGLPFSGGGAFGGNGGTAGIAAGTTEVGGAGGTAYGDLSIALEGGSGGAGGIGGQSPNDVPEVGGGGGGGGGGAIEIGATGNIVLGGAVLANGGADGGGPDYGAGGGAGGGILIHAPTVSLSGSLNATGGGAVAGGGGGGGGRIHIAANTINSLALNAIVNLASGGMSSSGLPAENGVLTTGPYPAWNQPPVARCHDVTVFAGANSTPFASIDNGSSDPDAGDSITLSQSPAGPYPLGKTIVTLTVTDSHGASSQCQSTVTVVYSWSGVLQPINADGSSVFKAGGTVPVKFQLTGVSAGINNAVARLSYAKVSNNTPGTVNEADAPGNATVGNLFQYDPTSGQYAFNWSTKGLTAGQYQLSIDLGDSLTRAIFLYLR